MGFEENRWIANAALPQFAKGVYGCLYNAKGAWIAPEPSSVVVPDITNSGAMYCLAGNGAPPRSSNAINSAHQLMNAGVQLGVRYDPFTGSGNTNPTPLSTIRQDTSALYKSGFYTFIFLDHALQRSDVQSVVDAIKAQGWALIATNETGGTATPPTGIWLHEKAFNVLNGNYQQKIIQYPTGISPVDTKWIATVTQNDPGSTPVLKLEVTSEIQTFATLSVDVQKSLLTNWAKGQSTYGYRTFYPFFVTTYYDCIAAGTYSTQAILLQAYG